MSNRPTEEIDKTKTSKEPPAPAKPKPLSAVDKLEFITSGVAEIDAVTMLPRGRITEIYGQPGVGKTSLMMHCIAAMSRDGKVLFIDSENALNPDRMRSYPVNVKNVFVSSLYVLEEVEDLVMESLNKYDVIIVDSVAGLTARTEHVGEAGAANIGIKAKLIHQWMRRMTGLLGETNCALVFVNQLRAGLDIYHPEYTTGGTGLTFAASLRIKLSNNKADRIPTAGGGYSGHWVHFEITKSKISQPHIKGKFKLKY